MSLLKQLNAAHLLKLFAIIFWYLALSFVVQFLGTKTGDHFIISTVRGGEYRWDYEAMYAAINLVWGIFAWKASRQPQKNLLFTDFTIWANIVHPLVMTLVGVFRRGEFYHLLGDSLLLFIPALTLLYLRLKFIKGQRYGTD